MVGNLKALQQGKRFVSRDLNRILTKDNVERILNSIETVDDEEDEIRDLVTLVREEIRRYNPERVVLLDIHSTSASGGIFAITSEDPESIRIGKELHVPVILDFAKEISGTTIEYFSSTNFGVSMITVVFECGQHEEALSVNRAIAAIINCMRTIGCINAYDVENKHDELLREYSRGLPKLARLVEKYMVEDNRPFKLTKAYKNFEPISTDTIIGYHGSDLVRSKTNGLILMPRLQDQSGEGFFVVRAIEY
jgi:succinylglutamate desuccinylase